MAGANDKRIKAANARSLQQLQLGFLATGGVYLVHLFLSSSGRSFKRLFLFAVTETIAVSLWQWMVDMAAKGQEINGANGGAVSYMFDVIYITWFVHAATALVSGHFWKVYWIIPLYALYRLGLLLLPRFFPQLALLLPGAQLPTGAAAPAAVPQGPIPANQPKPDSKRQEKLRKRAERGDRRVQYREASQAQQQGARS
ncbi:hypothetical protein JCM10213_001168 [Rhodosporidiobolus nylandii]